MSRFITASEFRAVAGEVPRLEVMDVVRGVAFVGALLLAWVTLRPFEDLSNMQIGDVTMGNEMPTYVTFGGFAALTFVLAMRENATGLKTLLSPAAFRL